MEVISTPYLIAIGIFLIGIEVLTYSFVLFFLGIGFVVTGAISKIYDFDNGIVQIATAFVIALVFAYFFRGKFIEMLSKTSDKKEQRAHVSGTGIVEDGMIKFNGTYWKTLDDISAYSNDEQVEIVDVIDNMVVLKK
ncbi:nodulation efficiency protein D (NfeD) [hydrothermal vent metagenome]|uniref:Nodulation efficiency protein D (NfeD) n=1 Tax=hydrothermal vent metagenome TaxID=652676 RepID=A0A1W1BC51_9ZZZZ